MRKFHKLTGLHVNAALDNATINRLGHLDVTTARLQRAKRFDADERTQNGVRRA